MGSENGGKRKVEKSKDLISRREKLTEKFSNDTLNGTTLLNSERMTSVGSDELIRRFHTRFHSDSDGFLLIEEVRVRGKEELKGSKQAHVRLSQRPFCQCDCFSIKAFLIQ